jgi:hypothetical protein
MAAQELYAALKRRHEPLHITELPALRTACAALLPGGEDGTAATAAAAAVPAIAAQVEQEIGGAIKLLVAALLSLPEALFADMGGAPKAPEGECQHSVGRAGACCMPRVLLLFAALGRSGAYRKLACTANHPAGPAAAPPPPGVRRQRCSLLGGDCAAAAAAACAAAAAGARRAGGGARCEWRGAGGAPAAGARGRLPGRHKVGSRG